MEDNVQQKYPLKDIFRQMKTIWHHWKVLKENTNGILGRREIITYHSLEVQKKKQKHWKGKSVHKSKRILP